ncbi:MAG: hypothetical protein FWE45_04125 [Firmicutes bacterium]|nr:hypothetical protein [Bacillota bacterium]
MKYFGTDGIRGRVGGLLTEEFLQKIASAIATESKIKRCVIGGDTRASTQWITEIMGKTFSLYKIQIMNIDVVSTAALAYMTERLGGCVGIMVTASHNPHDWNGVKLFDKNGEKMGEDRLLQIEQLIDTQIEATGSESGEIKVNISAIDKWIDFLMLKFSHLKNYKDKPKIFLDCANGSGGDVAIKILGNLGFELDILNNSPDGYNINEKCGATDTGLLEKRIKAFKDEKFIGFAFDGDADRCVAVNHYGDEIAGDALLASLAVHLDVDKMASTILFNLGAEEYLKAKGIEVIKTKVGDKYVLRAVKEKSLMLGGEPNGHIVFPSIYKNGDGLITLLMTLEMVLKSGKCLHEITKDIPIYPSKNLNVVASRNQKEKIQKPEFVAFIKSLEASNPNYKIITRPSGTEDIIRITVEGKNKKKCEQIADIIAKCL